MCFTHLTLLDLHILNSITWVSNNYETLHYVLLSSPLMTFLLEPGVFNTLFTNTSVSVFPVEWKTGFQNCRILLQTPTWNSPGFDPQLLLALDLPASIMKMHNYSGKISWILPSCSTKKMRITLRYILGKEIVRLGNRWNWFRIMSSDRVWS